MRMKKKDAGSVVRARPAETSLVCFGGGRATEKKEKKTSARLRLLPKPTHVLEHFQDGRPLVLQQALVRQAQAAVLVRVRVEEVL
jgi:hypothetical protein